MCAEFRKTEDSSKPPMIECAVPRGVLIKDKENDGRFIPLDVVTLREMTGEEEDMLSDESVDTITNLHRVVTSCVTQVRDSNGNVVDDKLVLKRLIGSHPNGLLMSDMLVLLFKLREVTVGDEYRQVIKCPDCETVDGEPYSWTHIGSIKDLAAIPVTENPSEPVRIYTTSRGNVINWTMLTGVKQAEMMRVKRKKDRATTALLMRVNTINNEPATMNNLKTMSFKERQEIRKQFDAEGGINTDIPVVCRNCGHNFTVEMEMNTRGFFFPSEV